MSEMPMKVVALIATEIGFTLGMGIVVYYSLRTAMKATHEHTWKYLKDL